MSKRKADAMGNIEGRELPKRSARASRRTSPLYKALVTEEAEATVSAHSPASGTAAAIIAKIKKCLNRANHPNANKAEAKAALHVASRLKAQHNVTQADMLAHEPPEARQKRSGQSTVSITRRDEDRFKEVRQNLFIWPLAHAIDAYFDVKCYTEKTKKSYDSMYTLDVVYYGLAENITAAAYAFEMVFNLIVEWARDYSGANRQNSYCVGISDGLRRDAQKEKKDEEDRAKKAEQDALAAKLKQEQAERQAELDRLADLTAAEAPSSSPMVATVADGEEEDLDDVRSFTTCLSMWSTESWNPFWASTAFDEEAQARQDLINEETDLAFDADGFV